MDQAEKTIDHRLLYETFLPHALARFTDAKDKNQKFVHYTTSEASVRIIQNKCVWLRNAACMNDYQEIQYGWDCLKYSFELVKDRFKTALDNIYPETFSEVIRRFDGWYPSIQRNTYILSISEHYSDENSLGRLSMWRAYGHGKGVALVMNHNVFTQESDALEAYTSPVLYATKEEFAEEFEKVLTNIENNLEKLKLCPFETIIDSAFRMLLFSVLSTKHPGFKEEKEWRVIYTPELAGSEEISSSVEILDGAPEIVFKIFLRNIPDKNFYGAEIPELVDRIIIGPHKYPVQVKAALKHELFYAGIKELDDKIFISDIPLRAK